MSKSRTTVPTDIAAEALFASDNTCCVCRERGKAVQIHHLDEDPNNHHIPNLAILCLECHNQTKVTGGFGRKLSSMVVVRYRDEWLERVIQRRDMADQLAIAKIFGKQGKPFAPLHNTAPNPKPTQKQLEYINALPDLKKELLAKAEPEWDSGVTARMVQASYDYIDSLQGVLTALASYYPTGHFGGNDPHQFFSNQISSRFAWHRSHVEPDGPGTGGTIVNVVCCGNVIADVEKMVEDMVMSLVGYDDEFDWKNWPTLWRGKAI